MTAAIIVGLTYYITALLVSSTGQKMIQKYKDAEVGGKGKRPRAVRRDLIDAEVIL